MGILKAVPLKTYTSRSQTITYCRYAKYWKNAKTISEHNKLLKDYNKLIQGLKAFDKDIVESVTISYRLIKNAETNIMQEGYYKYY